MTALSTAKVATCFRLLSLVDGHRIRSSMTTQREQGSKMIHLDPLAAQNAYTSKTTSEQDEVTK